MALSLALMSILNCNDEVIYFSPCYPSYFDFNGRSNVKPKEINLDKENLILDFQKLKKRINFRTKAIIINSPHNPTGKMLSGSDFKKLEQILKKYPKCFLITDEIYEKLNFSGKKTYFSCVIKKYQK